MFIINDAYSVLRSKIISKDLLVNHYKNSGELVANFSDKISLDSNSIYALNTALFTDGAIIKVAKNNEILEPIIIINIAIVEKNNRANFTKNFIQIDSGAKATILETYFAIGDKSAFESVSSEIILGENAHLTYYKIQNEKVNSSYIGSTKLIQSRDSNFESTTISLNEGFVRNEINALLNGV